MISHSQNDRDVLLFRVTGANCYPFSFISTIEETELVIAVDEASYLGRVLEAGSGTGRDHSYRY